MHVAIQFLKGKKQPLKVPKPYIAKSQLFRVYKNDCFSFGGGSIIYVLCLKFSIILCSDAVVMTGASLSNSQLNDSQNSASGDSNNITIKVQTPSQNMAYRLSKVIFG